MLNELPLISKVKLHFLETMTITILRAIISMKAVKVWATIPMRAVKFGEEFLLVKENQRKLCKTTRAIFGVGTVNCGTLRT